MTEIRPQKGFQESALSTQADIAIMGGAAGVGKTHVLLMEPLRHIENKNFGAVFFRRTYAQIEMEGGLWDKSEMLYPGLGATPRIMSDWTFPSGASISFSHLQYEKNLLDHQGTEYALILFDELTHFTQKMFFYLLSRNRSTCGVKPYVRATCNPDPNSWVASFISWWIDPETGFAIPERAGKLRYFFKLDDSFIWADSKKEILDQVPALYTIAKKQGVAPEELIKSVTFIPGNINENKILLETDPSYISNLLALGAEERARLLDGNWKISLDKRMIAVYEAVDRIFDNYVDNSGGKYITCDAARFGRDFAVIMVWMGWEVVWITVMRLSDQWDITGEIEKLRMKFLIPKNRCLIDQDGVGRNTVKLGQYEGFSGNEAPRIDRSEQGQTTGKNRKKDKLEYKNLKAQCIFRFLEKRVNAYMLRINISNESCKIDGVMTTKIKLGAHVVDIRTLIKDDLRSYRREDEPETTDETKKKTVEAKEMQKLLLQGRSPDFGDTLYMREAFELTPRKKGAQV
jgi:hypothetical protein